MNIPVAVCCKDCDSKKMIPVISKYHNVYCPKCGQILYYSGLSLSEAGKLIQEENNKKKREAELKDTYEHFELMVRAYFPVATIRDTRGTKSVCFREYTTPEIYFSYYLTCTPTGVFIKSNKYTEVTDLTAWLHEKNRKLNVKVVY